MTPTERNDMETKEFPIEVAASLVSGISLCKFDAIHECAEFVAGHPIWTHEFAEHSLWGRLRKSVCDQRPQLADIVIRKMTPEEVPGAVAELRKLFGETIALSKGTSERTEHPLESLERIAPGKPVIGVALQAAELRDE